MRLIRWLFSNILLIAVVLLLSYSYVYWGKLTDEDTPAGPAIAWLADEYAFVNDLVLRYEASSWSDQSAGTETAAEVASASDTADAGSATAVSQLADAEQTTTTMAAAGSAGQPVVGSYAPAGSGDAMTDSTAASGGSSVWTTPEGQEAAASYPTASTSPTQDKFVSPEIVASLTQVAPDEEPVTSTETSIAKAADEMPTDARELWIQAREAFHRRDFDGAISAYEKLIATTENNYDAHGELGNVYFNQGKIKQAAASYYDAAAVLVRLGQVDRAASLVGLLGRMDTEKALELQQLITSARS